MPPSKLETLGWAYVGLGTVAIITAKALDHA